MIQVSRLEGLLDHGQVEAVQLFEEFQVVGIAVAGIAVHVDDLVGEHRPDGGQHIIIPAVGHLQLDPLVALVKAAAHLFDEGVIAVRDTEALAHIDLVGDGAQQLAQGHALDVRLQGPPGHFDAGLCKGRALEAGHGGVQLPGAVKVPAQNGGHQEPPGQLIDARAVFIAVGGTGEGTGFAPALMVAGDHSGDEGAVAGVRAIGCAPGAVEAVFHQVQFNMIDVH